MTTDLLDRPAPYVPAIVDDATRRQFLAGIAAAGLLAACGSNEEAGTSQGADAPATRSVDHALGTTEVPVEPQRVVAVTGTEELDALVALGVVPVAAAELELGVGFSEQADPFLGDVAMLPTRREINVEEVATHRPDLIIGTVGWARHPPSGGDGGRPRGAGRGCDRRHRRGDRRTGRAHRRRPRRRDHRRAARRGLIRRRRRGKYQLAEPRSPLLLPPTSQRFGRLGPLSRPVASV